VRWMLDARSIGQTYPLVLEVVNIDIKYYQLSHLDIVFSNLGSYP
jgi:hypothetical protein